LESRYKDVVAGELRIDFQRTGGFAGLSMGTSVDVGELPPEEGSKLQQLVESLERSGADDSPPPGKPDRFQYEVTVTRGKESRRYCLAEQELSPEARELVKQLVERARAARAG
jgi:hypothetical protein